MSNRSSSSEVLRSERGVALIMALLVLVVIAGLSAMVLTSLNVETKITANTMRTSQALNTAEAGVAEAVARIRSGEVPDTLNPRMVTQIFLAQAGQVPVLGPDSLALATAQDPGEWLAYSQASRGPGTLTVKYKTDPGRTVIYRYDRTQNPAVQTTSGLPIYVIESTGRRGPDQTRVVAEVTPQVVNLNLQAGLSADVGINFSGSSMTCGFNHRSDTPPGTGAAGRLGIGGCDMAPGLWEIGSGNVPGARSTGTITEGGSTQVWGWPADTLSNQVGFYAGPWEAIGMSQAQFYSWMGPALSYEPLLPKGIIYLDNNSTPQDQSGSFKYNAGVGEGMLYVDGDLTVNGGFIYKGLIYVEGDLHINGVAWVLGAIVVKGKTEIKLDNGNCTILFSRDAVTQNIAKYGGQFTTLSWREGP